METNFNIDSSSTNASHLSDTPMESSSSIEVTRPAIVPFDDQTISLPPEVVYVLIMAWKGQKYDITVVESDTVGDLKVNIWTITSVPPERQKIVGLVKGKLPTDEVEVKSCLSITPSGKPKEFMMIGTPEGQELQGGPTTEREEEVDVDYNSAEYQAMQNVRNLRKLRESIAALKIDEMNPPRPGKKLLVLDLDYCILDTSLWKEDNFVASHFARPFLHQFLGAISPYYDIVIWSQTSWRWLETKLVELDIIGESAPGKYNIITTLDRTPMFSVYSQRDGKPYKHEVKALPIIWAKFDAYTSANTIHVDDLSRNFAINPRNGLKVKAFKNSMETRESDHELAWVARYLLQLVNIPDVTSMDHSKFKKCRLPLPTGVEDPAIWIQGPSSALGQGASGAAGTSGNE